MENCSNIKRLWAIAIVLLLGSSSSTMAQNYFNRLYTNSASGSIFMSLCPQGSAGGFMAIALVNDSLSSSEGLRISRFDANGNLLKSNFFKLPDYPDRKLYISKGAVSQINNNCFAFAGSVIKSGCCQYGFILLSDSNGSVYKYKNILKPCATSDSFMYTSDVKFDGKNIIILSHIDCAKLPITYYQLINKYDTSLNLIWSKEYNEGSYNRRGAFRLVVDTGGYVVGGDSDSGLPYEKAFKSEAYVFRTDTAGNVLWTYRSPTMMGAAADIVRTSDGGYVFSTMGNVYDKFPASLPTSDFKAQELLLKIDASGHKVWEKMYDPRYVNFDGLTTIRLLPTIDNGFMTMCINVDSPGTFDKIAYANLRKYDNSGGVIWNHKFQVPTDTPMYGKVALHDFCYTSDKGIVMAGYYDNKLATAAAPAQRGWLLKIDSNGCMGVSDPQCWPTSIATPPPPKHNSISIHPNPSHDYYSISYSIEQDALLSLYDINGRSIGSISLSAQKNIQNIDARQWATGVYLYRIVQGNNILYYGKLLKY